MTNYTIHIREDLYETNYYTEDGERRIASTFYLVAEDKRGARWASPHAHDSAASAKSERRHIVGRSAKDEGHRAPDGFDPVARGWAHVESRYGSEAWGPADEARLAALDYDR